MGPQQLRGLCADFEQKTRRIAYYRHGKKGGTVSIDGRTRRNLEDGIRELIGALSRSAGHE